MNYYDDVEARFGLDPEVADRLRSANILYDRDDNGEFFSSMRRHSERGSLSSLLNGAARMQDMVRRTHHSASPRKSG